MLTQATNRAKATLMSVFLLEQFILDLSHKFEVSVTGVTGNESRAEKELGYSDIVASDNYDFTIFNILKIVFRDNKNVRFFKCDKLEQVVKFNNCNILLVHGLSMKADLDKSVQQMIGKYASKGISIDFVFFGHIHSCSIGDFYARGSSLCGANAYSDYGLNLQSRASQNLAIFYSDKGHDVIKIDLQNTDGICGYDISKSLIENDVRRLSQNSPHKDIIEIR